MRSWAHNKNLKYLIPSENAWFAKLSMAIASNEMDEAVFDRQRPVWREGLAEMYDAQNESADRGLDEEAMRAQLLARP